MKIPKLPTQLHFIFKKSIKCNIKKSITDHYEKLTLAKVSKFDTSSKLCLYEKLKTNCKLELYLKNNNFTYRKLLSKFRLSDHSLGIEVGRYTNIPREQRLCKKCKVVDDEHHFFFDCEINLSLRPDFFTFIKDKVPSFQDMNSTNKLILILSPTPELVCHIGTYINRSLELRALDPCQTSS